MRSGGVITIRVVSFTGLSLPELRAWARGIADRAAAYRGMPPRDQLATERPYGRRALELRVRRRAMRRP